MMPGIDSLKLGDHAFLLYSTPDDYIAVATKFLKIGLQRNERCLFVAKPREADDLKLSLKLAGVDVAAETERGALILVSERAFLTNGTFTSGKMLDFLWQAIENARSDGFAGLRSTGNVLWEMGPLEDFKAFLQYEEILDSLKHEALVGLCGYDRTLVPGEYLLHALRHHPWIVTDGAITRKNAQYQVR